MIKNILSKANIILGCFILLSPISLMEANMINDRQEIIEEEAPEPPSDPKLYKIGGSDEQNELVQLAYELGGIDFVYTIEAESGFRSNAINWNTNGTYDKYECQLNSAYHSYMFDKPEFQIARNRIYYCYDVWLDGKKKGRMPFVGYWSRWKAINNFEWR